ncbi:hypothetical protein ACTXG6_45760 [Pseudonocardia sp. Cha107L01]|uniref:hypothetical protein n=1 Tax=Pseudonocardia sp. Cha107L01 TaxID=3457576 RepID=UPI00403E82F7
MLTNCELERLGVLVAQIDWGTAPAWGSVVVALVAVLFAGLGARAAIRGNRNQQRQIEIQSVQLRNQQKQLAAVEQREHREHASRISAWPSDITPGVRGSNITIRIRNTASEPITSVVLFYVFIQGAAPRTGEDHVRLIEPAGQWLPAYVPFGAILPGQSEFTFQDVETGIMQGRVGAEIAFTDRAGTSWIKRANGTIQEISDNPAKHYGLELPLDYKTAKILD